MSTKKMSSKDNPVMGFVWAGVAVIVWMFLGDFPGLREVFLWVSGDDGLTVSRPVWKYIATAVVGFLMFFLLVRLVARTVRDIFGID